MAKRGKIVLIGFMGAGKTTVAELLSKALAIPLCEMDREIIANSSCSSIAEIIDRFGETHFRDLEEVVAGSIRHNQNVIVSTGGGIVGRENNIKNLKADNGTVVYLRATFETLKSRVGGDNARPLFRDLKQARQLFDQRALLYESASDVVIDTDGLTPNAVCDAVIWKITARATET